MVAGPYRAVDPALEGGQRALDDQAAVVPRLPPSSSWASAPVGRLRPAKRAQDSRCALDSRFTVKCPARSSGSRTVLSSPRQTDSSCGSRDTEVTELTVTARVSGPHPCVRMATPVGNRPIARR